MADISFKGVKKIYENGFEAVKNFNIDIKDGEFIVLVGPSGCGKSTTLSMLAGLEEISQGALYIDGLLVNKLSPRDRDIAMVFQNYALFPNLNVYDNIAYGLTVRKVDKKIKDQKVREAARILEIEDLLGRKPRQLSGGQKQRVAIGRCIVRNPKVFLFDEPLSNLDAKLRVQMRNELIKLHQMLKATIVYVTHDQVEAMTMGSRIVVMKDGEVQQIGAPLEIFHTPQNLFTATFIGSPKMNILKAEVISDGQTISLRLADGAVVKLPDRQAEALRTAGKTDGPVFLGLRPENIRPAEQDEKGDIGGRITLVEMLGNEKHIYFDCQDEMMIATQRTKRNYERKEYRFVLNMEKALLFDTQTEKLIAF